ncbi:MAG: pre-peptidase C-terminal domain-containing protein [Alcanivoracaceae bacterium]|nr:pre-peptidase C-terminal domain-containing protein [Alcanivoracaceae bacterium]
MKIISRICVALCLFSASLAQAGVVVLQNDKGVVINDSVSFNGDVYNGDWYLPNGTAVGAVYLQHGFTRGGGNYRDLAVAMMNQGMMVLSINAPMSGGNADLANRVADVLANNPPVSPDGRVFPAGNLVLSGHSAGGLHVSLVAERMVNSGNGARIAGLVLFDPVNAFGPFGRAMDALAPTGIPVRAVTANGSLCNTFNDTQGDLRGLPRQYVGIKLTDRSTHVDSEGNNSDIVAKIACGFPREQNILALRDFGVAWAGDMLTGSFSADFYPGGARLNALLNGEDAKLIKDASGTWLTVLDETIGESIYGEDRFTVTVPAGPVGKVEITTRGGSGSADLYVRRHGGVSVWSYDCRDRGWGNNETCTLWGEGTYEILVKAGFWGYSGVNLKARYIEY